MLADPNERPEEKGFMAEIVTSQKHETPSQDVEPEHDVTLGRLVGSSPNVNV